jgi:hypothetical protein
MFVEAGIIIIDSKKTMAPYQALITENNKNHLLLLKKTKIIFALLKGS